MQQLLIEVNQQDQIFYEQVCRERGLTFGQLFMEMLEDYKAKKEGPSVDFEAENTPAPKKAKKETLPKPRASKENL